jgi:hypothetical protein
MIPESLQGHLTDAIALRLVINCQPKSVYCGLGRRFVRVLAEVSDLMLAVYSLAIGIGIPPSVNPDVRPSLPLFEL